MPALDLPLEELRAHRTSTAPPPTLEDFWRDTVEAARSHPLDVALEPVDNGLVLSRTHDLTFNGFDGQRVHAWLRLPAQAEGPLPVVVEFLGYSCGRSMPLASTWVEAGVAHLEMDSRGQGWSTRSIFPMTPDADAAAGVNGIPGMMTRGIEHPEDYYYRRLMTDAVRMVEVARVLDGIDPDRVFVVGGSQGGGLAIAAAALSEHFGRPVAGAMVDVPFLCDFPRALELAQDGPYPEIEAWLRARPDEVDGVFETLNHVDAVHLAAWASCPALFSVALRDPVCPPSTVFAAYNAWAGEKDITVYPFNAHEGGGDVQLWKQVQWVAGRTERGVER